MIKKRSHKIPLYYGRLYIYFSDNLDEVFEEIGTEPEVRGSTSIPDCAAGAFSLDGNHYLVFLIEEITPGIIAHEVKHFVNHLFDERGIYLDTGNDEPECYLLSWAVDKVHDAMERLIPKQNQV